MSIKVLQMGITYNLGGIETFLMNYYRNIDREQIQFDFINIYPQNLCFQDEINKLGGKVFKVSSYYRHPFRYIKEVKKIIKENNYQIVHCNMNSAAMIYPLIVAKISGVKRIIAHSHNSCSDKGILKTILHNVNKHFIPLFANEYFACSKKAGEWFFSKRIMQSEKFRVIYNAIDLEKYRFDDAVRKRKIKELNINDNTIVLGHVGRFSKQKNHTFLIDIFFEYHKKYENSILILVGTGPLLEEIKKKVLNLGIEKSVMFLENRYDTNELYQAMDLFLLPSLYEGLPLVGVEAQAAGIRCFFGSNISREVKLTTSSAFIDYDIKKWVDTMEDVTNTKEQRIENFKALESGNFNIKNVSKKLCDIYKGEK